MGETTPYPRTQEKREAAIQTQTQTRIQQNSQHCDSIVAEISIDSAETIPFIPVAERRVMSKNNPFQ